MRFPTPQFVTLSVLLTLVACGQKEELKKSNLLGGLDGTYRTEQALQEQGSQYQTLNYSDFKIQGDQLVFQRLNQGQEEKLVLGQLKPAGQQAYQLESSKAAIEQLSADSQLQELKSWLETQGGLRLAKIDEQSVSLSRTLVTSDGQNKVEQYRLKKITEEIANEQKAKVLQAQQKVGALSAVFTERWAGKSLILVGREIVLQQGSEQRRQTIKIEDLKEEDLQADGKKILNFKKLKWTDARNGLVNDKRALEINYNLLKAREQGQDDQLIMTLRAKADAAENFSESSLQQWGQVEIDENGQLKLTQQEATNLESLPAEEVAAPAAATEVSSEDGSADVAVAQPEAAARAEERTSTTAQGRVIRTIINLYRVEGTGAPAEVTAPVETAPVETAPIETATEEKPEEKPEVKPEVKPEDGATEEGAAEITEEKPEEKPEVKPEVAPAS